jgi:hypothetical protein
MNWQKPGKGDNTLHNLKYNNEDKMCQDDNIPLSFPRFSRFSLYTSSSLLHEFVKLHENGFAILFFDSTE